MKLERIVLKNFLSHRSTAFDISERNPVIIVGENGAGKSSLVKDSVTWALFGKARSSADELITAGTEGTEVRVEFEHNSRFYAITRKRYKNTKTELTLQELIGGFDAGTNSETYNWRTAVGATIAETQDKIVSLLGVDYETFIATACVEQGRADSLTAMTPKEAKELIMRIVQLGDYSRYCAAVHQKVVETKTAIDKLTGQLSTLSGELEVARKDAAIERDTSRLLELASVELAQTQDQVREKQKVIDACKTELATMQAELAKHNLYLAQLADAKTQTALKIKKLSQPLGDCPLCLSPLSAEKLHNIRAQFAEKAASYQSEVTKISNLVYTISERKVAVQAQLDAAHREWATCASREKQLHGEKAALSRQVGAVETQAKVLDSLSRRIGKTEAAIAASKKDLADCLILERAFGRDGIAALIVENVLPEIEAVTNSLLKSLSDGALSVSLKTQRVLKSGETSDTLSVDVVTPTGVRNYANLSGGEKFRVDLSLRIALSSVLARRGNFKIQTLIIDEGFGSLDAIGRTKFVELSRILSDQFKRIIIITHTDVAEMYAPGELTTVTRDNGVSKVA